MMFSRPPRSSYPGLYTICKKVKILTIRYSLCQNKLANIIKIKRRFGYFDIVLISFDESAKLDGAGHFRRFWQIVLPLVRPMVAVQALWAFMGPFGDYILSSFLLREKEYFTVAVGLQTFVSNVKNMKIAYFSAGAILIALPICILFFFLQKNFVSGLTSGGDKG